MTYTLDDSVPIPATLRDTPGPKAKYPFAVMRIGMSFYVPYAEGPTPESVFHRVYTATVRANSAKWNTSGRQWLAKDQGEGVRVWRVR